MRLKDLKPHHLQIIKEIYENPNYTVVAISQKIGCSVRVLYAAAKSLKLKRPSRGLVSKISNKDNPRIGNNGNHRPKQAKEIMPVMIIEDLGYGCQRRVHLVFNERV